jgi:hypothetical protein
MLTLGDRKQLLPRKFISLFFHLGLSLQQSKDHPLQTRACLHTILETRLNGWRVEHIIG